MDGATPFCAVGRGAGAGALLAAEWLLTDGAGGFAMGTASGVPTRRYHGWLIGAAHPPVGRVLALHSAVERIIERPGEAGARIHDMSSYIFPGALHPGGMSALERFEAGATARWTYRFGEGPGAIVATRELGLRRRSAGGPACAVVRYSVEHPGRAAAIEVRPLIALRDMHELRYRDSADARFCVTSGPGRLVVEPADHFAGAPGARLSLSVERARFVGDRQWWNHFEYPRESDRGQEDHEDLFTPGYFLAESPAGPGRLEIELRAWVGDSDPAPAETVEQIRDEHARRLAPMIACAVSGVDPHDAGAVRALARASDAFVVARARPEGAGVSVIAGYPWFADWGRDALIALPGLFITTGRLAEARSLLSTLGSWVRNGLVPNCFDDQTGEPGYNTADASLWFIHAACEFAAATGEPPDPGVAHACDAIVDGYLTGTKFGIRVDADGLVCAGDSTTQLTWMDARRDGVVFTPRGGKPVEISALWIHSLRSLARVCEGTRPKMARELLQRAELGAGSFEKAFWNSRASCLYDVLAPDGGSWRAVGEIRPNQVIAAALAHAPLTPAQRSAIVGVARARLLTDAGLRTLSASDPGYRGRFEGSMFERDRAYHNGTVWPWLAGPYAEARMRADGFSAASRAEARSILRPFAARMVTPERNVVLGSLPEVYDGDATGDEPRRAGGCPAQAWSVAEILRVLVLASRGPAGA